MAEQISDNVMKITAGDKTVYLVGTAHVLKESREEVERIIAEVKPDAVAVELCDSRYQSLKEQDKWKNLDIVKVIKEGKAFLLFTNMVLSSFQKRIGMDLGSKPGEEMIAAVNIAEENGLPVILADRDINVTLKRAWSLSKFMAKVSIIEVLLESVFTKEKVDNDQIQEMMKNSDILSELMNEFAGKLPSVKTVFIDERDSHLANAISTSPHKTIVAVIGKGHMNGVARLLEEKPMYDSSIDNVPTKKNNNGKIIGWAIVLIVFALFGLGFFLKGPRTGLSMLLTWVLVTGTSCSISALLVLSHPVTILSSFVVAPITTLNPTVGAGMFLAIIEAYFKKPKVNDFEKLTTDIATFKGFFTNRITKILIVFIATSIGASIGTFVAIPWVTSLLK